jgi:Rps23 Pro-64 3,4-dihydroxylase Tpa1-like proline 4-hydroxylase
MWRLEWPEWNAEPFRHVVVDDFVAADFLPQLLAILDEEPVHRYEADLYTFEATAPEPETQELRDLRDAFAVALCPILARVAGKAGPCVTRADMRAYAYRPGHFLLPHTDHQADLARVFAYAYYLPSPEPPTGGELELFAGQESARLIEPRANRLVVFEVGTRSLHQVREVLAGLRLSLAGWFYP